MASRNALDLRRQVGQLLIMGFDGTDVSARLRSMLGTLNPGGVILFKRNIEDPAQVHALLRRAQGVVDTPMLLCVDMEGGTVDRLRDAVAPIPSVADVAATGSPRLFRRHGRIIGEEICALGFNTDFAPCLDLRFEASMKVLGSRTVSDSPKQTIRYARAFLRGLDDAGVIGCGKHFPGLGEGTLDSHFHLPSIAKKWKHLWKQDLLPYRKLRERLPMVMVAHAAYPDVTGDELPATLSKAWIKKILKKEIDFKGLIISDDLEMGGVLVAAPIGEAAIRTLQAGCDQMLVCHKEEHVWLAFESVYKLAESDKQFAKLVAKKSRRVLRFKRERRSELTRTRPRPTPKTIDKLCRRIWEFTEELRLTAIAEAAD